MPAYYNEIDPYAAAWLRTLISAGHIAPGDVDERDIRDVRPDDLKPYAQCHFFAGIGVWSYALRRAGWPDDRPVWTGSCPCQPFSQAGAGAGFDDERHLWPDFHWLIRERQPPVVFGEQVASKDADPWIDLVQADLEAMAYAFGAVPFPAAGVGAPNIRDRAYWVAHRDSDRHASASRLQVHNQEHHPKPRCRSNRMRNTDGERMRRNSRALPGAQESVGRSVRGEPDAFESPSAASCLANTKRRNAAEPQGIWTGPGAPQGARASDQPQGRGALPDPRPAGPANGFWSDADWLFCRDGKWRAVEPGTFPLADGAPARVGRLRAYGNAINAEAAIAFIQCAMDFPPEPARTPVPSVLYPQPTRPYVPTA
ncbi:DNA cytosine methyltransferase [Pseudomonas sp. HR1]|uniref:DNA cytosine methyltransferase n=1 Tax=Pseudomonas sp. HR1 TaxID=1463361 RepID=UPI00254316D4|nr:DNA cytosine methyltransferase [Pseudomonas sp. HR1]MDK4199015.1 DNA cytosine methyltransferase [Pseudomonas sp. HR1]